MDAAYMARQPIFDRDLHIYGYELLYRRSPLENFFVHHDADEAVESLVHDCLHVFGFDRLAPGRRAFLNVTRETLLSGLMESLPKDRVVIELLETIPPDPTVIRACQSLKERGYLLALDDFVFRDDLRALLDLADIVKIDFLAKEADASRAPRRLRRDGLIFLAEKVESLEAYVQALDWGYALFQGNYFQAPEILISPAMEI